MASTEFLGMIIPCCLKLDVIVSSIGPADLTSGKYSLIIILLDLNSFQELLKTPRRSPQ